MVGDQDTSSENIELLQRIAVAMERSADLQAQTVVLLERIASNAHGPTINRGDKFKLAMMALNRHGANWSAIERECGVTRKTLRDSSTEDWVEFRKYFALVADGGQIGRLPRTGSKFAGNVDAEWHDPEIDE